MTCAAAGPAPGAAPAAAPEQAAAAPERMTAAPAQKATLAAAAPTSTQATTELQSVAAPLADRCGVLSSVKQIQKEVLCCGPSIC